MDVTVEDERVFLRGINAFVTNKEVWENPISKEKKIMFATKVLTKSNGEWSIVHVHAGDGSQIEVNPNGQMKRKLLLGKEAGMEGGRKSLFCAATSSSDRPSLPSSFPSSTSHRRHALLRSTTDSRRAPTATTTPTTRGRGPRWSARRRGRCRGRNRGRSGGVGRDCAG